VVDTVLSLATGGKAERDIKEVPYINNVFQVLNMKENGYLIYIK
jgi:hypothetical protein